MNEKKLVKKVISKEGLYKFLKRPTSFTESYGEENERKEAEKEWNEGFNGEECEIMTLKEAYGLYEEIAENELKEGKESSVFCYIDIEAIIDDDVKAGLLSYVVLDNGNVYLVRPS